MADKTPNWVIGVGLAVAVAAVFSGVVQCGFVDYDDPAYITSNQEIQHGFTAHSLAWAFQTGAASNWHPLTWLSHMLDVQLYGLKPAGHHVTNVVLHTANSILLFILLRRMTGALWRSAFVAALFALHPLRVESVAWVSERKDVLSTFFWMLTVWFYVRYVEEIRMVGTPRCGVRSAQRADPTFPKLPSTEQPRDRHKVCYGWALLFFALGLMAKPMLVTLPFVLLLLDFWPLGRWEAGRRRLLTEKVPFLILAVASSVVTFLVQKEGGAVSHALPFGERLANALISYTRYLGKTFWPEHLSVLYPHPGHWPVVEVLAAGLLLAAVTGVVIWRRRAQPYLAVGWFWFLGMLVPAIGIVQVGLQSMADRYSYLPQTGLFIMLAWGAYELIGGKNYGRQILAVAGVLPVAVCLVLTPAQVRYWENSETLFTHAVEVTDRNYLAYNNLGFFLSNRGQTAAAMKNYEKSLAINPNYEDARNNLGFALNAQGRYAEAVAQYEMALGINPRLTEAHNNLGNALGNLGRADDAIREYKIALEENPRHAGAHNNLGIALAMKGKLDEAIAQFKLAIACQENYASAHSNLGNAFAAQGKLAEAATEYASCLALDPNDSQAHNNLGNVLAQQGKYDEAAAQYRAALRVKPDNPEVHFNLGYDLARQGKRAEAEAEYWLALRQRPDYPAARQQLEILRQTK